MILGHERFFLGTDSAPHTKDSKVNDCCAGVYTGNNIPAYLAHLLDSFDALSMFSKFASENGRAFYGIKQPERIEMMEIFEKTSKVVERIDILDDRGNQSSIVPFMAGKELKFSVITST